ncbi:acyltransferase [Bdellovibrio sp. KM01]|uniref:acyltransferase family protein n=1 Tax=Bdellovibrio sp. KM01 TaxID=2748865 RepID=UPI0015EAE75C|nr:acyltransferase [Bdellovibrio sp. KM01]QLY27022.1 acyltransferase [Bdellovibrio sp. KM01]
MKTIEFFKKSFFSAAKYPALTGLRALAAYLVFTRHYPVLEDVSPTLSSMLTQGYLGVAIFFVLSGFLIHQTYGLTRRLSEEGLFVYFGRRFARIYPLYFVVCIATFVYANNYEPFDLFINLTMLKGFFNDVIFTGVAQAWSLTTEETFYFCAPIIFFFAKGWRRLALALGATYCVGGLLTVIGSQLNWLGFFEDIYFTLEWSFFGRAFEFFAGIGLSMFLSARKSVRSCKLPLATYIGVAGVMLTLYLLALVGQERSDGLGIFSPQGIFLNNWFSVVFIVLLIYGLATESSLFSKLLSTRLFSLLGKSSYAFYLLQQGPLQNICDGNDLTVAETFGVTILVSIVVFALIEEPINHVIRSQLLKFKKRPVRLIPTPVPASAPSPAT